jgi:hypothetical protein
VSKAEPAPKMIRDREIKVTHGRVTHTFGVEGERAFIAGDARQMIRALSKMIRAAARNTRPRSLRDETQLQFAVEVAHALIADLEAVREAVEVDREKDEREAAQALIAAKRAAWKKAVAATRRCK